MYNLYLDRSLVQNVPEVLSALWSTIFSHKFVVTLKLSSLSRICLQDTITLWISVHLLMFLEFISPQAVPTMKHTLGFAACPTFS